jgi:hypothetical protein
VNTCVCFECDDVCLYVCECTFWNWYAHKIFTIGEKYIKIYKIVLTSVAHEAARKSVLFCMIICLGNVGNVGKNLGKK